MIFKITLALVFLAAWFGLIGPWMVSAESDIPVLLWILLTVTGCAFIINKLWRKYGKQILRSMDL